MSAVCVLKGNNRNCEGIIYFRNAESNTVKITGEVKGLTAGKHGFHIHQYGDSTSGCISAGPHFNPKNVSHGGPNDSIRHVGDLGNIEANEDGVAVFTFYDSAIALEGPNSIIGRSAVIHEGEDDLGKGGHELSSITGNAGDRVCCGVIGLSK